MAAAEKKVRGRAWRARPGSIVDRTDDEGTLIGTQEVEDLSEDPVVAVIALSDQLQHHQVQNRTLVALHILLGQALTLGVLAMIGVASHWFEPEFAIQVLAITVTPSFTATLLVVRWAFRQRGRGG